ncbi:amino acid ABC transporter permease [Atribacter laminatus]|uniref:L-cystine transport system permease protein YecS n=1 Tax=Atribacter laminatus TaxID=2847778 RepID=A0A7T1ALF9_ATRLM|nr:amino acid ABC transporter permease [Atribacter laminatus]QPM68089.1 L-cystine transport system permease protein YecS [Atribacter laminatus]
MDSYVFIQEQLLPALLEGTVVTVKLILLSVPFGLLTGIFIAVGRVYGSKSISMFCRLYVLFFKGCPLLLLLFMIYFGLPPLGISFSPIVASVLGFVLCNGAYSSEYIRGAIQSVKIGQITAAEALGMTRLQGVLYIILPQAFRRALPGVGNEIIYLIKYSSLAYMITCIELTGAGKIVAARFFRFTETFIVIGIIYLILVTIATKLLNFAERKLYYPGMGPTSFKG